MPTAYDFKQLSPHEFELLSRDLIQANRKIVLESFKTGRDQGIDFRYARGENNTIVQCKHYAETGYKGLLRGLKKEAVKAKCLNPTCYMLTTSVALSPRQKATIQALFGSILASHDILGVGDLNNLLALHPDVERDHYKLWIASRRVLDLVINNASVRHSEFQAEKIHREIRRYVASEAYPKALKMLGDESIVVITGAPGVGKTTMADMLLYSFASNGYEPVLMLTDFERMMDRITPGKKQIFYYDDFLGTTYLGDRIADFTKNEDKSILDFIDMIKSYPNAKLIMTTREHILVQAIESSEKFKRSQSFDDRCVLELKDYSLGQRAEILYNHIYFSDLPDEYREQLLTGRFYLKIIRHEKFNPRLIEWLSTFRRIKSVPAKGYQGFVEQLLKNPGEIWQYAYEKQISHAARTLLLALHTYRGKCKPDVLQRIFDSLHRRRADQYRFQTAASDWRTAIKETDGSLIRIGEKVEVIDPSVLDLLNSIIRSDTSNAFDMLESAIRFGQALRIWDFALYGASEVLAAFKFEAERVGNVFVKLFDDQIEEAIGWEFLGGNDGKLARIETMLSISDKLQLRTVLRVAMNAIGDLLDDWGKSNVPLYQGVDLCARVNQSPLLARPEREAVKERIVRQLLADAVDGCDADELRGLGMAISNCDCINDLTDEFSEVVYSYRDNHLPDALSDFTDDHEFEDLLESIQGIKQVTDIDFEGAIVDVKAAYERHLERVAEKEEAEADDAIHRAKQISNTETSIDNLFDSLRKYE